MITNNAFSNILYALPKKIKRLLFNLHPTMQQNVAEIRLRKNLPLSLTIKGENVFLKTDGQTCKNLSEQLVYINNEDILECFSLLCEDSVFAHENELRQGFIIMKNGCRAGVCGRLCDGGEMQDITSINIRISREVKNCANPLIENYNGGGLLIAGPPGSGKTTMLRDFVRQLSNQNGGSFNRIAVIDARGEIAGGGALDLGASTDVLQSENKGMGVEVALRTMFPTIIAFDEIGNALELEAVSHCLCAGVKIVTTAHAESLFDIKNRRIIKELLKSGAIKQVAVLPKIIGNKINVFNVEDIFCECVT